MIVTIKEDDAKVSVNHAGFRSKYETLYAATHALTLNTEQYKRIATAMENQGGMVFVTQHDGVLAIIGEKP